MSKLTITGIGITTPIGQGCAQVQQGLLEGVDAFDVMRRPGRQKEDTAFLGAEIRTLSLPDEVTDKVRRTMSWSAQAALATLAEAWSDARLSEVDPRRVGLIVGGSNLQQRELLLSQETYRDRFQYLRPAYGQVFMDTDIAALCSEHFGIRGPAFTVGGASASGQLAVIQAIEAVRSGQVDACVALGALMDLSYFECQGLRALGAMGSDRFAEKPSAASRPFDRRHDGFIYGENCGAVVIERLEHARRTPYAQVRGWSYQVDAHRNPDPQLEGEMRAINTALGMACLEAGEIDYVNPHGTGSMLGDRVELEALKGCGLSAARINATKSILGHGLSAAGTVELIATVLQMQAGKLHPTRNLEDPIDSSFAWVGDKCCDHQIRNAVTASFGFGGINSAVCLSNHVN